jgi:hypothetical protein
MKLLRFTGMLALALLAWIGILIGLAFTAGPGKPLAIVTLPGRGLEVVAAAGGSYESLGGPLVITRSAEAGFVRRLYGAGALIVIDARLVPSCRGFFTKRAARNVSAPTGALSQKAGTDF